MLLIITLFGAYANDRNMMDCSRDLLRPFRLFRAPARLSADQPHHRMILASCGSSFAQADDLRPRLLGLRAAAAVGRDLCLCVILIVWPAVKKRLGRAAPKSPEPKAAGGDVDERGGHQGRS